MAAPPNKTWISLGDIFSPLGVHLIQWSAWLSSWIFNMKGMVIPSVDMFLMFLVLRKTLHAFQWKAAWNTRLVALLWTKGFVGCVLMVFLTAVQHWFCRLCDDSCPHDFWAGVSHSSLLGWGHFKIMCPIFLNQNNHCWDFNSLSAPKKTIST